MKKHMLEQLATCTKMTYNHALSKSDNLTRIHVSKKIEGILHCSVSGYLYVFWIRIINKVGWLLLGVWLGAIEFFFKSIIIGAI